MNAVWCNKPATHPVYTPAASQRQRFNLTAHLTLLNCVKLHRESLTDLKRILMKLVFTGKKVKHYQFKVPEAELFYLSELMRREFVSSWCYLRLTRQLRKSSSTVCIIKSCRAGCEQVTAESAYERVSLCKRARPRRTAVNHTLNKDIQN